MKGLPSCVSRLISTLCLMSVSAGVHGLYTGVTANCGHEVTEDGNITIVNEMILSVTAECANGNFVFKNTTISSFSLTVSYNSSSIEKCAFYKEEDDVYFVRLVALRRDTWTEEFSATCSFKPESNISSQEDNVIEGMIEEEEGESILQVTDVLGRVITAPMLSKRRTVQLTLNVSSIPGAAGVQPYACDSMGNTGELTPVLRDGCGVGGIFDTNEGFINEGPISRSPYFTPVHVGTSPILRFQCNITVCTTPCNGSSCTNVRRKRSVDIYEETGDKAVAVETSNINVTVPRFTADKAREVNSSHGRFRPIGITAPDDNVSDGKIKQNMADIGDDVQQKTQIVKALSPPSSETTGMNGRNHQYNSSYNSNHMRNESTDGTVDSHSRGAVKPANHITVNVSVDKVKSVSPARRNGSTDTVNTVGLSDSPSDKHQFPYAITNVKHTGLSADTGDMTVVSSSVISEKLDEDGSAVMDDNPLQKSPHSLDNAHLVLDTEQEHPADIFRDVTTYPDDSGDNAGNLERNITELLSSLLDSAGADTSSFNVSSPEMGSVNSDSNQFDTTLDDPFQHELRKGAEDIIVSIETELLSTDMKSEEDDDAQDNGPSSHTQSESVQNDGGQIHNLDAETTLDPGLEEKPDVIVVEEEDTTNSKDSPCGDRILGSKHSKFAVGVVVVTLFAVSFLGIWIAHCRKPRPGI